jgi:hypothetical protein
VDIQILSKICLCYITLEGSGPFQLYCFCGIRKRNWLNNKYMVKVKEFHNRPDVAQRVPGGLGSQISMTFST